MPRFTAALLCVMSTAACGFADNWPQWRGPKNDGHSAATGLPAEWSDAKNIAWKLAMPGPGSSTPCVWGDSIYITSMHGDEVVLLCIDSKGKELWRKPMGRGDIRTMRDEGGNLASASCTADEDLVYAFVGSGMLAAFDHNGTERWSLATRETFGDFLSTRVIQFGGHWTPVLHDDVLYHTIMHRQGQHVLAIEARTGKILWKIQRPSDSPRGVESPDVYSSPFIWTNGEQSQLIVHGNDYCTGHSLEDGKELWRVTELNPKANYNKAWRSVSSPLALPNMLVIPSCKNGVTVAIDPLKAKGEIAPGNAAELWRIPRGTPDVPSPIAVDDLLYLMNERGRLYCHELATGKLIYDEQVTNMRHRANPVYADGKLFLLGRDGTCVVVKPGREFEKLAENKLPDTFTASPAITNGTIYLRGWDALYAIKAP